jgi:hypothetical protein
LNPNISSRRFDTPVPSTSEMSLEKLRAERKSLADLFNKNPQQLHLAIRIKGIDDQIAECTQAIRNAGQRGEGSESRFKPAKSQA